MGLAILFFLWFRGVLFLGGSFPPLTLYHTSCQVSRSNLCSAIFLYLISGCPLNFGSRGTDLIGRHQRSWGAGAARGACPPNPPIFYYIIRSCVLSSVFLKKYFFFFFFLFIFPLLLYHISVPFVKYFSKTFSKKFFKFFLTLTAKCSIIIIERKEKRKT